MGYPMTYSRVVSRNGLHGDYKPAVNGQPDRQGLIAGDLRRLEHDQMDLRHLTEYAKRSGATRAQVAVILRQFFDGMF